MLELKQITKDYQVAGESVHALKGVSLKFRRNEFVSILGPSGCGKTTLLNIIGGLDKYTSGDLVIEGKSTKEYKDGDWDTYRNHSIGFIFQGYHLIPHQTVLQNVELALTIAGVEKEERRARAVAALERVGLGEKLNVKPNQLSGGQAQRVAIARALINDPEIVLADEPTGALDSKTSVQIMELLKEIAQDRLVIMVTHNPELAEQYSTRIIKLFDGELIDDSMPFDGNETAAEKTESESDFDEPQKVAVNKGKKKRSSMSFGMAFMLSLKNLFSKKGRTIMVSIAGSIGIIGISMVLAFSAGVRNYIADMQNDMLSGYPIAVKRSAFDFSSVMNEQTTVKKVQIDKLGDKVYVDSLLDDMMTLKDNLMNTNEITYDYVSYVESMPKEYYNVIKYGYGFSMANYIYTDFNVVSDTSDTPVPEDVDSSANMSLTAIRSMYASILGEEPDYAPYAAIINTVKSIREVPDNYNYILSQYDILATYNGKKSDLSDGELKELFTDKGSLVLVVSDSMIEDLTLGQYGFFSQEELLNYALKAADNEDGFNKQVGLVGSGKDGDNGLGYDYFFDKSFKWYPNNEIYTELDTPNPIPMLSMGGGDPKYEKFHYNSYSKGFDTDSGIDMKVKVILQKKEGVSYGCLDAGLYYTKELTDYTLQQGSDSEIVKYIVEHGGKDLDVIGYDYDYTYYASNGLHHLKDENGYPVFAKARGGQFFTHSDDVVSSYMGSVSYSVSPAMLGGSDLPSAMYIYPVDFGTKQQITDYLDRWNDVCAEAGTVKWIDKNGKEHSLKTEKSDKITYTDNVGLIISMIDMMIKMITIALVSFTALALVVSTVMIGIITYVSVVERIKEIGILRSVGARKKDIKQLFNAETFIIGFSSGVVGILVTYILSAIISAIVFAVAGIAGIAALPWWQAIIMVAISVVLTLISGLIPASSAAKKDPVVALRTE